MTDSRPLLIGVTGGIGSGKSTVAAILARLGAATFSADAAVHRLYADADVRDAVVARWGDTILDSDGKVDRAKIAAIVFENATERAWLEGLLHPLVAREWLRFVHEQSQLDPAPSALVAEVPLLFEGNLEDRYDVTMLVTAPLDLRLQRVGKRASGDHLAEQRAALQLADADKAARADIVIVNDGTEAHLEQLVEEEFRKLAAR